jgi:hypothetical protein
VLFLLGLTATGEALADRRHAGRHGHRYTRTSVGFVVGAPLMMPWYYPSYYPPIIIERQAPPVYIERSPVYVEQPPVEREAQTRYSGYWYYCQSPSGYYPEVRECPGGWVKVPPRP